MGLGVACKAFFRAWRDRAFAEYCTRFFQGQGPEALPVPAPAAPPDTPAAPPAPARSDALTLLAALQREARLIDFLQEDLSGYDDAQIGAAVRDVHRDCAAVLERMFALRPLRDQAEGTPIEIDAGVDPVVLKLTGNVTGPPPFQGRLTHPGWQARHCDVPAWTGQADTARVIAPAEVEVP